jgi:predicted XRE-type DNA-binding protein
MSVLSYYFQLSFVGLCVARLPEEIQAWHRNTSPGLGSNRATLQASLENGEGIMTRKKDPEYEIGSGNVFADLELDDADVLLTRAQLGLTVRLLVKQRKLKQREIAMLLDIDQAEVSRLMNGQYHLFAEGRLFAYLKCLEQKVTIKVSPHHEGEPYQQVTFASSRRRDPRDSAVPTQGSIQDDLR